MGKSEKWKVRIANYPFSRTIISCGKSLTIAGINIYLYQINKDTRKYLRSQVYLNKSLYLDRV